MTDAPAESLDFCFTASLYRPFLDLGTPPPNPSFTTMAVELDYRSLEERKPYPRLHSSYNGSFRDLLVQVTDLPQYDINRPDALDASLWTERWRTMCAHITEFRSLPTETQISLIWLLNKLCFYRFALDLLKTLSADALDPRSAGASFAYLLAWARYREWLDQEEDSYQLSEFEHIARTAGPGMASVDAHYQMVVQNVKFNNDLSACEYWQPRHLAAIDAARSELGEFDYQLLMSRYHRVGGFLPQMRRDRGGVEQEMDLAEEIARNLPRQDPLQRLAADEILYPVLQSRMKEAVWLGDIDLAIERADEYVQLSPFDPLAWIQHGDLHATKGNASDAVRSYSRAIRVAPPGEETAQFMIGQCHEATGDLESAADAYLAALRADPLGVSAAERLVEVTKYLGDRPALEWAQSRLTALTARRPGAAVADPAAYQHLPPPTDAQETGSAALRAAGVLGE